MRTRRFAEVALVILTTVACGQAPRDCTVDQNADGSATLSCTDGFLAVIEPGKMGAAGPDGSDGPDCNWDAKTLTFRCPGANVTVRSARDGAACRVARTTSEQVQLACSDGRSSTIPVGVP